MGRLVRTVIGVVLLFVPGMQAAGVAILLGEAASILGPKPPRRKMNPQTVSIRGTTVPGTIVYGEARTAGMIYIPAPGVSGAGNKYLHYIIVLAAHECEIGDIWFDNAKIEAVDIDGSGNVTGGEFSGKTLIERYIGTDAQTVSATLLAAIPLWTTSHLGGGICYLHLRLERDENVYPSGPPQNVFAMVKGRRVYDPRSGLTAWSDNPALCLRDYLVTYCSATVDDTLVAAAANICDETVTVPSGTQKRYRCAGVLSTGEEPVDNINSLLSAMSGTMTFTGGKFRMYAGAYDAPTQTITDDWLAGPVSLQITTPGNKLYNIVRAEYIDPDRNHQLVEAEPQVSAAFQTIDGRELEQAISLPLTPNEYQAQRQAFLTLNQSRGQRILELPLNMRGLNLNVWETVNVNIPRIGVNEVYRVMSWRYADGAPISVILREDSSGFYQPPSEYLTATTLAAAETIKEAPEAPNNLTITAAVGGVLVAWTNPPSRQFDQMEVWRSETSARVDASLVATVRGTSFWDVGSTTNFYWIRASNGKGGYSAFIPTNGGSEGTPAEPPPTNNDLHATLSTAYAFTYVSVGSAGSTGTVRCVASGGTGPYTYAWERVSGSTDIAITSPTADRTTFTAPAGAYTELNASFRCVVTDSASPEAVVNSPTVIVEFQWVTEGELIP